MKYIVVKTTIEKQEVEAESISDAFDEADHYPFPSQWEKVVTYTVAEVNQ